MGVIYHITRTQTWEQAKQDGVYRGDTLATEGFIHCSTREQVASTANRYYRGQPGLVLLEISEENVAPEIRYEESTGGEKFPHIYGALDLPSVVRVIPFEARPDGSFVFPE